MILAQGRLQYIKIFINLESPLQRSFSVSLVFQISKERVDVLILRTWQDPFIDSFLEIRLAFSMSTLLQCNLHYHHPHRTYRRFIKAYYNPGQNIWKKVKDASKVGHDQKALLSSFA